MWRTSSRCNGGESGGVKEGGMRDRSASPWRQRPRKSDDRTPRAQPTVAVTPTSKTINLEVAIVLANGAERQTGSKPKPIPKNQNGSSSQSLGGKLLKVLRRKMLSSNSGRMESRENSSAHDDKSKQLQDASGELTNGKEDEETLSQASSHESLSVDQLQEELLVLRQRFDKDRAEMLKLRNEVTLLRLAGKPVSSHPQHHIQAAPLPGDSGNLVTRTDSVRSDVSCLDFSLASSGLLKFEGEAKAKIKPVFDPHGEDQKAEESTEQRDLCLSDTTTSSILEEDLEVSTVTNKSSQETKSTENSSSALQLLQEREEGQKDEAHFTHDRDVSVDGDVGEPEFVIKHCHDHTGADLKLTETLKKPSALQIPPAGFMDETKEYCHSSSEGHDQLACNSSRSPPKSASSTDDHEPDTIALSYPGQKPDNSDTDSEKSFILHKEDLLKVASSMSVGVDPKSTGAGKLVGLDLKAFNVLPMVEMQYKQVEGRSPTVDISESGNQLPEPEAPKFSDVKVSSCRTNRRITLSPLVEKLRTDLKTPTEEDLLKPRGIDSVADIAAGIEWARQQSGNVQQLKSDSRMSRAVSSPKSEFFSLKAQPKLTDSGDKSTNSSSITQLQVSVEAAPVKVTMFSRSRSQSVSSARDRETSGTPKLDGKVIRAPGADAFPGQKTSSPRRSSIDLGCGLGSKAESRYPELELDKLSKTLKSLKQGSTPASPTEPERTSKLIFRSTSSTVDTDKTPRLSLDSQTKAFIFSDSSRIGSPWNNYSQRSSPSRGLSPSRTINASAEGRSISTVDSNNDKTRIKWSSNSSNAAMSPGRQQRPLHFSSRSPVSSRDDGRSQSKYNDETAPSREGGRSPLSLCRESMISRDGGSSPSRNLKESISSRDEGRSPSRSIASESQLKEIVNNAMLKSGRDTSMARSASAPLKRSTEKLVSEKQAPLSTSRQLFSDPSSSPIIDSRHEDDHEAGRKIQREEPFSVLALSRRRRSLEKIVTSPLSSPDLQQQDHSQESGLSSPSERRKLGLQSRKADGRRIGAEVEKQRFSPGRSYELSEHSERRAGSGGTYDDHIECGTIDIGPLESNGDEGLSNSNLRELQEAVDVWDKGRETGAEAGDNKFRSISSMPLRSQRSRSRFYVEAQDAGLYRTASLANSIFLTSN